MPSSVNEIQTDKRFAFGKNWKAYIQGLSDHKIERAKISLQNMLGKNDLSGVKFLDIGCGSGLFSLAAYLLGAQVTSFDYDQDCVESTEMLKERFAKGDDNWTVSRGDILDESAIKAMGKFDIVYSWGVLHHTGDMWSAIHNASSRVKKGGTFFIAIYNEEGFASQLWTILKKLYVSSPSFIKAALVWGTMLTMEARHSLGKALRLQNPHPNWEKREEEQLRGMSIWYDYVDWVGGYPFEVATPCQIFSFCKERGFKLDEMVTVNGHGCNEFVFSKS